MREKFAQNRRIGRAPGGDGTIPVEGGPFELVLSPSATNFSDLFANCFQRPPLAKREQGLASWRVARRLEVDRDQDRQGEKKADEEFAPGAGIFERIARDRGI